MNEQFVLEVDDDGSLLVFSVATGNFMIRLTEQLLDDEKELKKAFNIAAFQEIASRLIAAGKEQN